MSTEPSATKGSAATHIAADADTIYACLTDLDRLPEFSPENQRCEFLDGATEVAVGVRFRGDNRAGSYEWSADCIVTVAERGREFAYDVPPDFAHATTWRYVIEPAGEGCTVTESFDAPLLAMPDLYPGRIEGRRDNLERACEITLANLKAALER